MICLSADCTQMLARAHCARVGQLGVKTSPEPPEIPQYPLGRPLATSRTIGVPTFRSENIVGANIAVGALGTTRPVGIITPKSDIAKMVFDPSPLDIMGQMIN